MNEANRKVSRRTGIANVKHRARAAGTALVALFLLSAAALMFASAARAEPSPTPNGFCGAKNMVESWPGVGPGVPPDGGMQNAMTVDNASGNAGMFTAVGESACS